MPPFLAAFFTPIASPNPRKLATNRRADLFSQVDRIQEVAMCKPNRPLTQGGAAFGGAGFQPALPEDVHPRQARITVAEVERLEAEMDTMNEDLPPLRSFVLPGGGRLNAELHICRAVCRRAERACVALARVESVPPEAVHYWNRLSDALFVWSRWASRVTGSPETLWEPNRAASGLSE